MQLFKSSYQESDIEAVSRVIRRSTYWAEGPEIEQFEKAIIDYMGVPGVLVCNSGTSALHMALLACGVKYHHEVIVPSFTFVATVNAVKFVGAEPVFADIEPQTYGLDPQDVEKKITGKTKAIIAVHYGGHPCKIKELRKMAFKHNLLLIEDAAEAMGAIVEGKQVGTFGDCAILSFCQSKIISTGEGGAVVTGNKYFYDQARLIRSHGKQDEDFVSLGYNFRMSSMQAALGISQLERISDLIQKRQQVAHWYKEKLPGVWLNQIKYPSLPKMDGNVFQLYTIQTPKRDLIMRHLQEKGIPCKIYFNPIHLSTYYKRQKWEPVSLPVTEQTSKEVLSLPMYPDLTESEVDQVCESIKEVL
jgi:dTDP-4-amino-4,6-dideoxygalactose transaminase